MIFSTRSKLEIRKENPLTLVTNFRLSQANKNKSFKTTNITTYNILNECSILQFKVLFVGKMYVIINDNIASFIMF